MHPLAHRFPRLSLALALLVLSACTVGPEYKRPETTTPGNYKSAVGDPAAVPLSAQWWTLFEDPTLNELEQQAAQASPQLQAAVARVTQARAIARVTEADFYPNVTLDPAVGRTRFSGNRPVQPGTTVTSYTVNRFSLPLDVSYEVDLWGKIRNTNKLAVAQAEATADAYETVRLTLFADVAQNYFALRSLDSEYDLVNRTIEYRKQGVELIRARYRGGASSELDVVRAEAEVATNESELIAITRRRAELENALAVLVGKNPIEFKLPQNPLTLPPPAIPVGLPSELLQRRPDVAEAERRTAARNAEIGVATAAFFPSLNLTGALGFESSDLSNFLTSGSRAWTLFGGLSQPIFEGGRNRANLDRAKAAYEENLANYRQQVLIAFEEVESALVGLRLLAQQSEAQARAVSNSERAAQISGARYRNGLVYFLDVLDAERTKLTNQRLATEIEGQRLVTSVSLIKALGGGWNGKYSPDATASAGPAKANTN